MKISKGTIARTVVLLVSLVNMILTNTGHTILPFSDAEINELISNIFVACASIAAWYKNNSFSQEAIKGDILMHNLKNKNNE